MRVVSECVGSQLLRRAGGGEGEGGADAALKTKTPHVNVGKKSHLLMPLKILIVDSNRLARID